MHKLALLFIFCVTLLVTLSWFKNGYVIGGAEEGLSFLNPTRSAQVYENTWNDATDTPQASSLVRFPDFFILSKLQQVGITPSLIQILTFFVLFFLSSLAIYLLAKEVTPNSAFAAAAASLFYVFNSFVYANIWHRYLPAMMFFQPLLPLSVYFFYQFYKTKNRIYVLIFLGVSFLLSSAYSLPSNIITIWIVLVACTVALCITRFNQKQDIWYPIYYFFFFLLSWTLTNLWWLIPVYLQIVSFYGDIFSQTDNLNVLRSLSQQFPLWMTIALGYKDLFSKVQIALAVGLMVFVVAGIVSSKKSFWKFFLILLLFLSVFFLNSANPPTGVIFEYFFLHISPLQLYRDSYEKFGIVLALTYALFLAAGIVWIFRYRIGKALLLIFLCLYIVWYIIPTWSHPFGDGKSNFYVKVPSDYQKVNNVLNFDNSNFRLMSIPMLRSESVSYKWGNGSYFGGPTTQYLFDKPSYENLIDNPFTDVYWNELHQRFYEESFTKLLKYNNIKYILLHKDIWPAYSQTDTYSQTLMYLRQGTRPTNISKLICPTIYSLSINPDGVYRSSVCEWSKQMVDLKQFQLIHVRIRSSQSGYVRLDIITRDNNYLDFSGTLNHLYFLSDQELGKTVEVVFNLKYPTEKYPGFSFNNIQSLGVSFYPVKSTTSVKVNVLSIGLDKGEVVHNQLPMTSVDTTHLILFKIQPKDYLPLVYPAGQLLPVDSWKDLGEQKQLPRAFYLTDQAAYPINYHYATNDLPTISFTKVSPVRYMVNVKNARKSFWLIFSDNYNKDWVANKGKNSYAHFIANGFTNGYFISNKGSFQFEIVYQLQSISDSLKIVAISTFFLLLLFEVLVIINIFTVKLKKILK